jgi:hypothetical protein
MVQRTGIGAARGGHVVLASAGSSGGRFPVARSVTGPGRRAGPIRCS